ncbi:hypothetical protein QYE76_068337, partial [Lolium multiflorum]
AIDLSTDHKPNEPGERARIEAAGGSVVQRQVLVHDASGRMRIELGPYRVDGIIAVSRALGDFQFKKNNRLKLICNPDIHTREVLVYDASGRMRIELCPYRVNGIIAVSRALGDFQFKKNNRLKLICNPDIHTEDITDDIDFLLIASDGIWEVKTSEEVVTYVNERLQTRADPNSASIQNSTVEGGVAVQSFLTQPCDLELLQRWVGPRIINGITHPSAHELNIYSTAPSVLATQYSSVRADDGSEAWYFFTRLQRKGQSGSRVNRSVDVDGVTWSWHGEHKARPVHSAPRDGHTVGFRRLFSFSRKDNEDNLIRDGWIMSEYGLNENEANEVVLCKIHRTTYRSDHSKRRKRPRLDHASGVFSKRRPLQQASTSHTGVDQQETNLEERSSRYSIPAHPRNDQLIAKLLHPRQLSGVAVHEVFNVYELSPMELIKKYPATVNAEGTPTWYFYTSSHVEGAGISETGRWSSQLEPIQFVHDSYGQILGHVQFVKFFESMDKSSEDLLFSGYTMSQFSGKNSQLDDIVLCTMGLPNAVEFKNGNNPTATANANASCSGDSCPRPQAKTTDPSSSIGAPKVDTKAEIKAAEE